MKACIFTTSIDKKDGGPSRSVPILAKGLTMQGIDTILLTCASSDMNSHIIENTPVKLITLSSNISHKALEKLILNERFDIIHAQNLWNPLYHKVAKIARRHNIPYIMTPRGCLEPWCLKHKALKKKLALFLYQKNDLQKATCILATSKMEATNIRNIGINAPIAVIPNGIDVSEYRCRQSEINVKKQICFISRIHQKKGLELLIEVWSKLYKKYPEWKIIIAGNGEKNYIDYLNNLIVSKGLYDSVKILPPVFGNEKQKLYSESALFILPSYSENFGMVIAEAMSCGLPVITTKNTPWEMLNENNIGWCIDLSLENLQGCLNSAINLGMDSLFEMGQHASLYIKDNYHFSSVAKRINLLYDWIKGTVPKPDFIYI